MFVCSECCVLSGRGLCDELNTRPEESFRLWCVVVCNQETSYARRLWSARRLQNSNPLWVVAPVEYIYIYIYIKVSEESAASVFRDAVS